jgi:Na+/proline symporter
MTESKSSNVISPLSGITGAAISAALCYVLYLFTLNVARKLALSPFQNAETLADRVGAAFRTILLALGSGITIIFGVIAIGLVLLTIKQIYTKVLEANS